MPIDFADKRWDEVRRNYGKWWSGGLERRNHWLGICGEWTENQGNAEPEAGGDA